MGRSTFLFLIINEVRKAHWYVQYCIGRVMDRYFIMKGYVSRLYTYVNYREHSSDKGWLLLLQMAANLSQLNEIFRN